MKSFVTKILFAAFILIYMYGCFNADSSTNPPIVDSSSSIRIIFSDAAGLKTDSQISTLLYSKNGDKEIKNGVIKLPPNHIEFDNIRTGKYVVKFTLSTIGYTKLVDSTFVNIESHITKNIYLSLNESGNFVIKIEEYAGNDLLDFPGNPILTKYNTLTEYGPYFGRIIYDENKFKMWYANSHGNDKYDIGYAESYDGFTWYIVNGLVLQPGPPGSWDSYGVRPGAVIKENNVYKMYYCGNAKPNNYKSLKTGLAISYDGKTWYKSSKETIDRMNINGLSTDIIKIDDTYFLYYGNNKIIGVATSTDGINWQKNNRSIILATEQWEGGSIWSCTVIRDKDRYKMLYTNKFLNAFGYSESVDGLHWTKKSTPVFTFHETNKMWPFDIRYPLLRKIGQTYYIFYSTVSPKWECKMGVAIASELK